MNQPQTVDAVSVAILRDGLFLLVRRARQPARGLYAFPGGRVEPGEGREAAARREVFEETGLTVEELEHFDDMLLETDGGNFALAVFVSRHATGIPVPGDDADDVGWYGPGGMAALPVTDSTLEIARRIVAWRPGGPG